MLSTSTTPMDKLGRVPEAVRERTWGLLRVGLFFLLPVLARSDELARSHLATVAVVLFFLHPLGFVADNRRGTLLWVCLSLQCILLALHWMVAEVHRKERDNLPGANVDSGLSLSSLRQEAPSAASSAAALNLLAVGSGERHHAVNDKPTEADRDDVIPDDEEKFHRPFAELLRVDKQKSKAGSQAVNLNLGHSQTQDTDTPILYHVSTQEEENAHLGGISDKTTKNVISIVLVATPDDSQDDVGQTVYSFINQTDPLTSIAEVVVVDPSGKKHYNEEQIRTAGIKGMESLGAKASMIRLENSQEAISASAARNLGARLTRGAILVFADAHLRASKNWMVPIVRNININYKRVVAPVLYDIAPDQKVADPRAEIRNFKLAFSSWKLDLAWVDDMTNAVPVMRGTVFALTRQWWNEVGKMEEMPHYESACSEYSLRSWLAGGELQVARDSVLGQTKDYRESNAHAQEYRVQLVEKLFNKNARDAFYKASPGAEEKYKLKYQFKVEAGNSHAIVAKNAVALSTSTDTESKFERLEGLMPQSRRILEDDAEERVVLVNGARVPRSQATVNLAHNVGDGHAPAGGNGASLELKSFTSYLDYFTDEFVNQGLLEPRRYRIENGACDNCCMHASLGGSPDWRVAPCDTNRPEFLFYWFYGNGVRNAQHRKCLDGAFPSREGHLPIAYSCMKVNRNQEWQFLGKKLMWGSYCLEASNDDPNNRFLKLQRCMAGNKRQEFSIVEQDVSTGV